MPTYKITAPDGTVYRVTGDGTKEEALQELQRQLGEAGRPQAPEAPSGIMQGLRDVINAPAQMLSEALPTGVTQKVNEFNNWLADKGLPLERLDVQGGVSQQIAEQEKAYQAERAAAGIDPEDVDWGRIGGNVGGALAGGWATGASRLVPQAASLGGRLAQGAGIGAATGALTTPVTGGGEDFWTEKALQAGIGAGAGAAGEAVLGGLGALGRQAGRADVRALQAEGVEPTIGQAIGGMASRTEEKLGSIPLLGDAIGAARQRAQDQWILAAERRAMEGLPDQVTEIGQAGIREMQDMTGRAYRAAEQMAPGGILLNRPATNALAGPGTQAVTAGQEIMQLAQSMQYATGDSRRVFERFLRDKFGPRLGRAQGFDPVNFKELDSELSTAIAKSEGQAQDAFRELRRILRSTAADQNPAYAEALNVADRAYSNLVRLEAAANRTAAKEGVFTPGQLQLAAKYSDRSVRHRAAAAGEAPMQDIANLGQRVLGDRVPTSGTTERAMTAGLAGGGALIDPVTTALLAGGLYAGGQALWSPLAQRLLVRSLQGAGSIPQGLGGVIGGAGLYPDVTGR